MSVFNKELYWDNPYKLLSAENKGKFKNRNYSNMLMDFLCGMFTYEKSEIYADIDDSIIEKTLIINGMNGWWKDGEKVVCGFAWSGGKLDTNGVGGLIQGNTVNGKGFTGNTNIDCTYGFNNPMHIPDRDIAKFADYLTECDISQECAIRYTRNTPVYSVKNNKIKLMLENALKRIFKGDPITITDDSLTLSDKATVEVVNLTDPTSIDKLQYLSVYHNELLRRFSTWYGQALAEGSKLAQQSIQETSSNISNSFVIPLNRLREREKMCERLEKVFGGSIKVKFTEPWQIEYDKWSQQQEQEMSSQLDTEKEVENNDNN